MSGSWKMKPAEAAKRAELGEVVGGGYWIFKRMADGRLCPGPRPFEHPSREAAEVEARRVARKTPGHVFVVVGQLTEDIRVDPAAVGHD